jgi:hypothetical protein
VADCRACISRCVSLASVALRWAARARRALSAAGMSIALRFWGARRAASPARWGSLSSSRPGVKAAGGFAHQGGCEGD